MPRSQKYGTINERNSTCDLNKLRWGVISKLTSFLEYMVVKSSRFEAVGLSVIRKSIFVDLKLRLSKSNTPTIDAPSLFIDKGIP